MDWIISNDKEITIDSDQLDARRRFIATITGTSTTPWRIPIVNRTLYRNYRYCQSDDGVSGVFITAHIGQVMQLCTLPQIANTGMVVANTCIWDNSIPKYLLQRLKNLNHDAELWFAKQELCFDDKNTLHQSTVLADFGRFGFQSSVSERDLFRYRHLGLQKAIEKSFERISPVLFLGD